MLILLLGCADTLQPEPLSDDTGASGDTGPVILDTEVDTGGLVTSSISINATDYKLWVYFDLDSGSIVEESDPAWDLAMRRYVFALSGGVMGDGSVTAAPMWEQSFADLSAAPTDGYLTDTPDDDDEDKDPQYVLGEWYSYDSATHILSPADVVYVIATDEAHHRFQVLDYYSEAGTSGHLSFQWGAIASPEE